MKEGSIVGEEAVRPGDLRLRVIARQRGGGQDLLPRLRAQTEIPRARPRAPRLPVPAGGPAPTARRATAPGTGRPARPAGRSPEL
jgi:hypothetical protein